jgi:DNA-binding NtrC family response regulator
LNIDILKDKNILFVEDDELVVSSIELVLKKVFKKVFICKDGEEGLEAFQGNKHIDFVITDLKMAQMDGLDMVAKIKAIKEEIPSILMSADADYESFLRADEIGIYRYLLKPLDIEELLKAMVSYLEENN